MKILASNITSPLGATTDANYRAVRRGETALSNHAAGTRGIPFAFCGGLFADGEPDFIDMCTKSAAEALSRVKIDKSRTAFILSTTKSVIGRPPGEVAKEIALRLGIENEPVVVCNACVSGVAAQVLAQRLIDNGAYHYAVITGGDVQSKFIISGFHSLKALSPHACRPFDIERQGLNLGEAAATMVVGKDCLPVVQAGDECGWYVTAGSICNDAYHISNPHPKAAGTYKVLSDLLAGINLTDLACISVHGTATMYNDQMESVAIERAGLLNVPISALKGYYGHTMGAAGLLETILTIRALDDGIVLPSKGFEEIGVSGKVNISAKEQITAKRTFVKILSGFGGVNAGVLVSKRPLQGSIEGTAPCVVEGGGWLPLVRNAISKAAISEIERLKRGGKINAPMHVVLFNKSSTKVVDREFEETIADNDRFYPSPSLFVYTLPNIVTGEIAMRYGWQTETSLYILRECNVKMMEEIVAATVHAHRGEKILYGWIDCPEKDKIEVELKISK